MAGAVFAAGIFITMIPVGMFVVDRDLEAGSGKFSYSTLFGVITSGLLFLSLVIAGIIYRNKPAYHKRFMLLATIVVLWPAWFRFRHYFPAVPRPDIWFGLILADSLIIFAWIHDYIKLKRIHPVLLIVGSLIIIEQTFEVLTFGSPLHQDISEWIYNTIKS